MDGDDARGGRALAQGVFEVGERLLVAAGDDLDAAVATVSCEAAEFELPRVTLDEGAVGDALDATLDDVATAAGHQRRRRFSRSKALKLFLR